MDGLDCLGLVLEGLRRLGVEARDPWDELRDEWQAGIRDIALSAGDEWERIAPPVGGWRHPYGIREGDVLVTGRDGVPSHVALAIDADVGLHTVEHLTSHILPHERCARRLLWVWRHKG